MGSTVHLLVGSTVHVSLCDQFRNCELWFLLPVCEMRIWNQKTILFRFFYDFFDSDSDSGSNSCKIPQGTGIGILKNRNRANSSLGTDIRVTKNLKTDCEEQ